MRAILALLLRNPLASLLGIGLAGAIAFGGWQWYWRNEAEKDLVEQKMKILTDANDAWKELNDKQQAFMIVARQAIDRVEKVQQATEASNQGFKKQVFSNVGSKTPLSAADLSDLSLLVRRPNGEQTSGSPIRP